MQKICDFKSDMDRPLNDFKYQFIAKQKTFLIMIFVNTLNAFGITKFTFKNITNSQIS